MRGGKRNGQCILNLHTNNNKPEEAQLPATFPSGSSDRDSPHHRGKNGISHNARHNHDRSYGGGHHHSPGQQPLIEAAAAASAPTQTPCTALAAHAAGPNTTTSAPPASMRIGQAANYPNQRQPGTFRTTRQAGGGASTASPPTALIASSRCSEEARDCRQARTLPDPQTPSPPDSSPD